MAPQRQQKADDRDQRLLARRQFESLQRDDLHDLLGVRRQIDAGRRADGKEEVEQRRG